MNCEVCGVAEKKYRCPTCLIRYCSKECFVVHKSKCIKKPEESVTEPKLTPQSSEQGESIYCEVPEEKLELLKHSEPLRLLLRNPHLREYLKMVDDSPNPEMTMHKAMQEPLFLEFVDVCMETIKMEST